MSRNNQPLVTRYAQTLTAKIIAILCDYIDPEADEAGLMRAYTKLEKLIASETITEGK